MFRILILIILILPFSALGQNQQNSVAPIEQTGSVISQVETYLNSLSTFSADFLQVAPSGEESTGKFYLSKPGRFRWEYNPPMPILITAYKGIVSYYDKELDQISHVPSGATLAGFLAREKIQLSGDIKVLDAREEPGLLKVKVTMKGKEDEGKLTLIFSSSPMIFKKMIVEDASGKETQVTFENQQTGMPLDKELFIMKDPRLFKRK